MITKKALKDYLSEQFPNRYQRRRSLEAWLIRRLCEECGTLIESRLNDIVNHGCVSGCVSELIYTSDCLKFYGKYEEKIWELVEDFLENTGETLGQFLDAFRTTVDDPHSFKTMFAWFAVEETAHRLIAQFSP